MQLINKVMVLISDPTPPPLDQSFKPASESALVSPTVPFTSSFIVAIVAAVLGALTIFAVMLGFAYKTIKARKARFQHGPSSTCTYVAGEIYWDNQIWAFVVQW